jgi:hypothetical protein
MHPFVNAHPCSAHIHTRRIPSFVLIQLLPHLLDALALFLGLLAVLPGALEAQAAQAHVDLVLCVRAVAGNFPEEAAGVAFVEGGDDVGAAWWDVRNWGLCMRVQVVTHSFGLLQCGDGDAL